LDVGRPALPSWATALIKKAGAAESRKGMAFISVFQSDWFIPLATLAGPGQAGVTSKPFFRVPSTRVVPVHNNIPCAAARAEREGVATLIGTDNHSYMYKI